ncbi:hypothetical protein ElyMa_002870500 [Elysia marginata]|uniref:Uncharacterized protein n=1 Tax=Elysia marginata TaxID=1093978 RepID=A0AAV4I113_9GAST|nr:hypothetical protein ElyMa_002870500 [Elysia marginata]
MTPALWPSGKALAQRSRVQKPQASSTPDTSVSKESWGTPATETTTTTDDTPTSTTPKEEDVPSTSTTSEDDDDMRTSKTTPGMTEDTSTPTTSEDRTEAPTPTTPIVKEDASTSPTSEDTETISTPSTPRDAQAPDISSTATQKPPTSTVTIDNGDAQGSSTTPITVETEPTAPTKPTPETDDEQVADTTSIVPAIKTSDTLKPSTPAFSTADQQLTEPANNQKTSVELASTPAFNTSLAPTATLESTAELFSTPLHDKLYSTFSSVNTPLEPAHIAPSPPVTESSAMNTEVPSGTRYSNDTDATNSKPPTKSEVTPVVARNRAETARKAQQSRRRLV